MTIDDHAAEFAGRPIEDFNPETGINNPNGIAYAIRADYYTDESTITDRLQPFFDDPRAGEVEAIVIGIWEEAFDTSSSVIVDALVAARDTLKNLKAIFLGDIHYQECEISWIQQSDVAPLLTAFPKLEHLKVRGGEGLAFSSLSHTHLKSLTLEAGGLSDEVIRQIGRSHLPALEHLELWLGTDNYGGTATVEDLDPILSGRLFPKLRFLGLKNAEIAGDIARALIGAPVVENIETLDLSMGTLTDADVEALGDSEAFRALGALELSDNYLTEEMLENLRGAGLNVLSTEQGDPDTSWRYCSVAE